MPLLLFFRPFVYWQQVSRDMKKKSTERHGAAVNIHSKNFPLHTLSESSRLDFGGWSDRSLLGNYDCPFRARKVRHLSAKATRARSGLMLLFFFHFSAEKRRILIVNKK